MNQELVRRWNAVVGTSDTVIHLGDFCFNRREKDHDYWSGLLNGNKVFVQGNHDKHTEAPIQSLVVKYGGIDWYCSHYPERKYKHNLCGHVHNLWKVEKYNRDVIINVGVDVWEFAPVSIDEVIVEAEKYGNK